MKDIVEHFGMGFLQAIGSVAAMLALVSCIRPGGVLNMAVTVFMDSICG